MDLEDLRHRRRARRSRRQIPQSTWGTASLMVGAGAFVVIYLVARSCTPPTPTKSSLPLVIHVNETEVRIDGQVVLTTGDGGQSDGDLTGGAEGQTADVGEGPIEPAGPETELTRAIAALAENHEAPVRVVIRGSPGAKFSTLQTVTRAVERAGLEAPRLEAVNPPGDRRAK